MNRVMPTKLVILGVAILLCGGCQRLLNSASPTNSVATNDTAAWAPCVVVQSPGGAPFNVQMDAAGKLQRAGKMTWIRLNTHLDGSGLEYHLGARRMGLRVFSIIHLNDLESA